MNSVYNCDKGDSYYFKLTCHIIYGSPVCTLTHSLTFSDIFFKVSSLEDTIFEVICFVDV